MSSSSPATKADTIGVLVLEEFACFEAVSFIEFICRSKEYKPNLYVRWRDSNTRPEGGFKSHYGRCDIVAKGKSIDLHLFDLPMSLPRDFNLGDLILPVAIRGCLLLANLQFSGMSENGTTTWPKKRFPGWLNWIRAQNIPFLVAVTESDSPVLTVDKFRDYRGLKSEIQVLEIHSHITTNLHHVFETTEAKRVLTTLVDNIFTSAPSPFDG